MSWQTHGKTLAMGAATVVMAAVTAFRVVNGDGVVDAAEWITVTIAVASTINVWLAANVPAFSKAKTVVAALFVVLNLVQTFITNGISPDEWLLLLLQFLGALGVAVAPSVSKLAVTPSSPAPARFSE
jgi:hypothetical protein